MQTLADTLKSLNQSKIQGVHTGERNQLEPVWRVHTEADLAQKGLEPSYLTM